MALVFPVLTIFDDSLDYRWTVIDGGPSHDLSAPGEQSAGEYMPCGRSMSTMFDSNHRALILQSRQPVVLGDFVPLLLSFVLDASEFVAPLPICSPDLAPTKSVCAADFCVSLRSDSTSEEETLHYPLCRTEQASYIKTWIHVEAPLQAFGLGSRGSSLNQVVFTRGSESKQPWALRLDDLRLASSRMLKVGDLPPSYGRSDNAVYSAIEGHGSSNDRTHEAEHRCEYMSAETLRSPLHLPLCKMDGDQLDGQWVQTCDPRKIERPDRYAYGRALHQVPGKFGHRLCYRQSATERLRTMQAMSWSWQPRQCALAPVRGDAFDRWLGNRTILFVGDSLSTQSYYSLLWLLGDTVVEKKDMHGSKAHAPDTWRASEVGVCESTVGTEGGVLSSARLRSGGQLIKVMRHVDLVTDLKGAAFWLPYLERADIIVLNIGQHYHHHDPTFSHYSELVQQALGLANKHMKPTGYLVFRTTNIGHLHCSHQNATRPAPSRAAAWQKLAGQDTNIFEWRVDAGKRDVDMFSSVDKYNWRGAPLFEPAWERIAGEMAALHGRFAVLNVSFIDMRTDGHVAYAMNHQAAELESLEAKLSRTADCLHYCLPGPADFWALAIFNLLLNNRRYAAPQHRAGQALTTS